jgi:gliding motility-associated-like protein
MIKKYFVSLILLFFSHAVFAQLADFTLTVNATAATCVGNGVLNFSTSGTNPEGTVNFSIYLLPNTTTPIVVTPQTSLTGLNPGTYKVIATQNFGTLNNSQQQEINIANQIVNLNYNLTGTMGNCLVGGTITASVTAGNPVSYQIINGPSTTPLQTTPTFTNLAVGTYDVRIIDACGQGVVKSYTITSIETNPNAIVVSEVEFYSDWAKVQLPACDLIRVGHRLTILPESNVPSPLTFTFTTFPPDGSTPIITTHSVVLPQNIDMPIHPSLNYPPLEFIIPYFDEDYEYDLTVTDACGNTYYINDNEVTEKFSINAGSLTSNCGKKIEISPLYFRFPVIIDFLSAPAGFNPVEFNSSHPVYNLSPITYQSVDGLPEGTYVIKATDNCGREVTKTVEVINGAMPFSAQPANSCEPSITILIPGRTIVAASFVSIPNSSPVNLPYDLAAFIIPNGNLVITGILTTGNYIVSLTDNCGHTYTYPFLIVNLNQYPPLIYYLNGCDESHGSVSMKSGLQTVELLSGPASYQPGFPHDVSFNLSLGNFYMNSLPSGIYSVKTINNCGYTNIVTWFIGGYFSNTEIEIFANCSSFDLFLNDVHTNTFQNEFYWIQKQDPVTGSWGHPLFGGTYIEGDEPDVSNSMTLENEELNTNIGENGHYRIITKSEIYNNGNNSHYSCLHYIKEFDVSESTTVNGILNFACSPNSADVYMDVSGIGPFNFTILEKNGEPFIIENNQDPLFTNLATGIYKIQIEDNCGNLSVFIHDVSVSVAFAIKPVICGGQYSTLSVPYFPYLEYQWFKAGAENVILSTDAALGFNSLDFSVNSGLYYVKIIYPPNPESCLNRMLSFEIDSNMSPDAGEDNEALICELPPYIDLNSYLQGNFDTTGTWEQITDGGNLLVNVWNLQDIENGTYQFKYVVNGICGAIDEAIMTFEILNGLPVLEIENIDSICAGNTIDFNLENANSNYNYSWTGPNNFTSAAQNPSILNATPQMSGTYAVTVTMGTCEISSSVDVMVLPLPDFNFTEDSVVICSNQSTTLEIIPLNDSNDSIEFYWYLNGELIVGEDAPILEVTTPGSYSLQLFYGNCSTIKNIEVTESTNFPETQVVAKCDRYHYIVSASALNNSFDENTATYSWSGPNGFSATTQSIDITGLSTGTYTVIVTDATGCSSEVSTEVRTTNCKIPKGLSPNGDGQNDSWDLSGFDIDRVKIYNRYGLEVYDEYKYKKEWYGQSFNGNLLPTATYYYYIKFTSGEEATGWVYLSREIN